MTRVKNSIFLLMAVAVLMSFSAVYAVDTHDVYFTAGNTVYKFGYPSMTPVGSGIFAVLPDSTLGDNPGTAPAFAMGIDYYNGKLYVGVGRDDITAYQDGAIHMLGMDGSLIKTMSTYYSVWNAVIMPEFLRIGAAGGDTVRVYTSGDVWTKSNGWFLPHVTAYDIDLNGMAVRTVADTQGIQPVGSLMRVNLWQNNGGLAVANNVYTMRGWDTLGLTKWNSHLHYGPKPGGDDGNKKLGYYNWMDDGGLVNGSGCLDDMTLWQSGPRWAYTHGGLAVDANENAYMVLSGGYITDGVYKASLSGMTVSCTGPIVTGTPMGFSQGCRFGPDGKLYFSTFGAGLNVLEETGGYFTLALPFSGNMYDFVFVPRATDITVSGKVVLSDIAAQNPNYDYKATLKIYKSGNTNCASPDVVKTVDLDANGNYSFTVAPQGAGCTVVVKAGTQTAQDPSARYHFLAKKLTGVDLSANAALATVTLPNGDINDDNLIDAFDFTILMQAYDIAEDTSLGQSDLTNDGMVDAFDFTILMLSYDTAGDTCN